MPSKLLSRKFIATLASIAVAGLVSLHPDHRDAILAIATMMGIYVPTQGFIDYQQAKAQK